jgi:transposase
LARSKTGQAIRPERRTQKELNRLRKFIEETKMGNDLKSWRRAVAVMHYIEGKRVVAIKNELGVDRSSVNNWLIWYNADGVEGLRTKKQTGAPPKLDEEKKKKLALQIEEGPQASGFTSGVWTGPMIARLIQKEYGVKYHDRYVPHLLHQLGFSVQRPRKRLARADFEAQEIWITEKLPTIKKSHAMSRSSSFRG